MKKEKVNILSYRGVLVVLLSVLLLLSAFVKPKKIFPLKDFDKTQILFLGDSNFANDYGGGALPSKYGDKYDVVTYDCTIGGTSGANLNNKKNKDSFSEAFCFHSIAKMIETGDYAYLYDDPDLVRNRANAKMKYDTLKRLDLKKLDYVVINYGMNDYLEGVDVYGNDEYSYSTAMTDSLERIHKMCPNAKLIVCSVPFYYYIDSETKEVVSGNEYSFGGGNLYEYRDCLQEICTGKDYTVFVNTLDELGIDESNCLELMQDNVHMTGEGQDMYVELLHKVIEGN